MNLSPIHGLISLIAPSGLTLEWSCYLYRKSVCRSSSMRAGVGGRFAVAVRPSYPRQEPYIRASEGNGYDYCSAKLWMGWIIDEHLAKSRAGLNVNLFVVSFAHSYGVSIWDETANA